MNAESVVALLENNWVRLRTELGDDWQGFAAEFGAIVARLVPAPGPKEVEGALDDICDLLARYEYGRGLLQGQRGAEDERLLESPARTKGNREQTPELIEQRYRLVVERLKELRGPGSPSDARRPNTDSRRAKADLGERDA